MRSSGFPSFFLVAAGLILGSTCAAAQPAVQVADINTTTESFSDPLFTGEDFAVLGTDLFFLQDDGIHGVELWKTDGTAAGTVLLQDICPGSCSGSPHALAVSNGVLYFSAYDGVHGWEPWRSDGTPAGTVLLKDVYPGLRDGILGFFSLDVNGILYFAADDGVHGSELWKTDGTAAGTVLVADLRPGAESSLPRPWLDLGGGVLLLVADDGVHGNEPFLSDGTAAGTTLLADINPGTAGCCFTSSAFGPESSALALGGGSFLFSAYDGVHGFELWKSDGTAAGTALIKDIETGVESSFPYGFTRLGSEILFGAFDSTNYRELWKTDGTAAGTVLLKDINTNPTSSSFPRHFSVVGSQAFFEANSAAEGREVWITDGTSAGTRLVKDINPGSGYGIFLFGRNLFRVLGSEVLFFGVDPDHGLELWKSDGTEAGTVLVKDIEPGTGFGVAYGYSGLTVLGSEVYFHGVTTTHGVELWKSDGTADGTVEVANVATIRSGVPVLGGYFNGTLLSLDGKLLFNGDDGITGPEPWVTDGTTAGTSLLADFFPPPYWSLGFQLATAPNGVHLLTPSVIGPIWTTDATPAGSAPLLPGGTPEAASGFTPALGTLFFAGYGAQGAEPWKTDGTAAGTTQILDINPNGGSNPASFTPAGSAVVFTAFDGYHYDLWRTDGTFTGTYKLTSTLTDFGYMTQLGSAALFTASMSGSGKELFRANGTLPGTTLLKDIRAGAASSDPSFLKVLGTRLLFTAFDDASGRELWATDGTAAGTVLLKDIDPGAGSGALVYPSWTRGGSTMQILGANFYFLADDGTTGAELWKTDGTPAGTAMVADVYPGVRSSEIDFLTVVGSRLFFVADDGVHGRELWVSDGTAGGTHLVKDVIPGAGSPVIQDLAASGSIALFSADDGVHGREMWRSNGTALGTFQVQDIAPGAAPSSPMAFFPLGDQVYFAANDNATGFELWKVPTASLLATFQDVPADYFAWRFIEALVNAGVTGGCGTGTYCPSSPVTRAQASVFVLAARGGAVPPATGTVFQDVPSGYWAGPWIEELASEGIVGGCSVSPPLFCPNNNLTRAEMAVILLAARGITPPAATGTVFSDVPANYWAAPWIEELARQGVTSGCGGGNYCPGQPVTRGQMAVFLVANFGLPLP